MTEHSDNLTKRLDTLSMLVDYLQKRVGKLEEESSETRNILTQLQISIGNLHEYLERQRQMEEDIMRLSKKLDNNLVESGLKYDHLDKSMKRVETILWGLILALLPGIIGLAWEVGRHLSGGVMGLK